MAFPGASPAAEPWYVYPPLQTPRVDRERRTIQPALSNIEEIPMQHRGRDLRVFRSSTGARYAVTRKLSDCLTGEALHAVLCKTNAAGDLFIPDGPGEDVPQVVIKQMSKQLAAAGRDRRGCLIQENPLSEMGFMQLTQNPPEHLLAHPGRQHVVGVYEMGEDRNFYYSICEFGGVELFEHADQGQIDPPTVNSIVHQLVLAHTYLHELDIVNLDTSLENAVVLVRPGHAPLVKLIDLGLSRFLPAVAGVADRHVTTTPVRSGKKAYMAPEARNRTRHINGALADGWGIGISAVMLAIGCPPWEVAERSDSRFAHAATHGIAALIRAWNFEVDANLMQLIERTLRVRVDEREAPSVVQTYVRDGAIPAYDTLLGIARRRMAESAARMEEEEESDADGAEEDDPHGAGATSSIDVTSIELYGPPRQ